MGKNSNNAVALHAGSCGGKLKKTIVEKPNLKGEYELYLCEEPTCNYVGRGARVEEPKKKAEAPAAKAEVEAESPVEKQNKESAKPKGQKAPTPKAK